MFHNETFVQRSSETVPHPDASVLYFMYLFVLLQM